MFSQFQHKKVFLTGHTGFKGSWMTLWLQQLGASIKGYALAPEKQSLYGEVKPHLSIESVIADIRNAEKLKKEIIAFQPDFIFHMAAQPLVRQSYAIPLETFEVNTMGTANVLEGVRNLKKKCHVIIITTDKVYANNEWQYPYRENDRLGGHDPYSASKAAAEIIADAYKLSFFHPLQYARHKKAIATARAGNVIGGGDYAADRIVPDIFRALSKSKVIKVRNPKSIRPWQHVLEPLSGYLTLASKLENNPVGFATSYNFGPFMQDKMTVEELVKESIDCWGNGKYDTPRLPDAPHEAGLLKLDISKAMEELGWEPKWDSAKAIEKTINWYKRSMSKDFSAYTQCISDIENYES